MHSNLAMRIELEAARALVQWKSVFAERVAMYAQQLAAQAPGSDVVTLEHFQSAARFALNDLTDILNGTDQDGERRAA